VDPDFRTRGWRLEFVSAPARIYHLTVAAVVNPVDPPSVRFERMEDGRVEFRDEADPIRIVG
jgi:hypothetical protein